MIDPAARWPDPETKPPYAGLVSFAGLPWSEDPADLAGIDAAIVGAPFDMLASDRPGTREGPRAIRVASRWIGSVVGAGATPIVLGGDHSITQPSLRANKMNDEASSLKLRKSGTAVLWEHIDGEGVQWCFSGPRDQQSDLANLGFDDQASSSRIYKGEVFC